jgi:integrase
MYHSTMKLWPDAGRLFLESGILSTHESKRCYRQTLQRLQGRYPKLHVGDFTPQQLTQYCLDPGLAPNSRRSRRSQLCSFFSWATFAGIIGSDPSSTLRHSVKVRGGGVVRHTWMDSGQIRQLIQSCDSSITGRRIKIVLLIGVMLGLRRAEICNLRWTDLPNDLSTVTLVGKGSKLATLGIPPQLRDVLESWRSEAPGDAVFVIPQVSKNLESIDWSACLKPDSLGRLITRYGQAVGIPIRPHDLRRTFAGLLDERGMKVTDIQALMRHSNLGTTSTYLEQNPRRVTKLAEGLSIDL